MVFASAASAATTVAPFTGKVLKYSSNDVGGCATGLTAHKGSWSLLTGVYAWAASSTSKVCGGSVPISINSHSTLSAEFVSSIKINVPSGAHSVASNFSAAWMASGAIAASGKCPTQTYHYSTYSYTSGYCATDSFMELIAYAEIFDATNQSFIRSNSGNYGDAVAQFNYSENYTSIYGYCPTGGNCTWYNYTYSTPTTSFSSTGSTTATAWTNGTFAAGHHYYLLVDIFGYVSTYAIGFPHASAKASLNAGTSGNGVTLKSIYVA
jgi:hypothetical protein